MVRGGNRCLLCAAFVGARQAAAAEVARRISPLAPSTRILAAR